MGCLKHQITITKDHTDIRLDSYLAQKFYAHSRSYFQYLLEKNAVTVNKKICKKRYKTKNNDLIELQMLPLPEIKVKPEAIDLDIIYEDDYMIVINKPPNMCTHPAPANTSYTVAGALVHHIKELKNFDDPIRPGIVHRLDKETSGVMIAAKTPPIARTLSNAFKQRNVKKTYLAICHSLPTALTCNLPIFRDEKDRKKMGINLTKGRQAQTTFQILEKNDKFSLCKAFPVTGRTHQIRVHLKALCSPIIGDKLYAKKTQAPRAMLHALTLEINHPVTNAYMQFTAPIAKDFFDLQKKIFPDSKNY